MTHGARADHLGAAEGAKDSPYDSTVGPSWPHFNPRKPLDQVIAEIRRGALAGDRVNSGDGIWGAPVPEGALGAVAGSVGNNTSNPSWIDRVLTWYGEARRRLIINATLGVSAVMLLVLLG